MTGPRDWNFRIMVILCLGILAVAVGMIIVLVLGWLESKPESPSPVSRTPAARTLYPCRNEDGSGQREGRFPCVWDARSQGNGEGRSFVLESPGAEPVPVSITD
ncbi:hypothetical protein DMP23_04965 [Amycolatopsis sp. A1MSW2902]